MNDETCPEKRQQRYLFLNAVAHFEAAWESCWRGECRTRQTCAGGPRGTCKRLGVPLCRRNAPRQWWQELERVL